MPTSIPAERLICEKAPKERVALPPLPEIDWDSIETVEQAKAKHLAYVKAVMTREQRVSGYIVMIEGQLFLCSTNVKWIKDVQNGVIQRQGI